MTRVLLLMSTRTYRARAFLQAARTLGVEVVVGTERRQALAASAPRNNLALDFRHPARAVQQVTEFARERPLDAVVGVDDDTVLLAAMVAEALRLPHNTVESVQATRDKALMRRLLAEAGLASPWFEHLREGTDPRAVASRLRYPCVLKPTSLSASRGVIRADGPAEFLQAFERLSALLKSDGKTLDVLLEGFIPGPEVALEGLLRGGTLEVLAVFDKPDPLDGPFFEETLYVTPSRHPRSTQDAITRATARAADVLGLRDGPLHAELRLGGDPLQQEDRARGPISPGPFVIDIAARSIGGLCSNTLRFGTGMSLEELILRHALGSHIPILEREDRAAGVMMLPIPRAGVLRKVRGMEEAERVPGVEEIDITIPLGQAVVPLPEGDRYLGFLFARATTPEEVEAALREAHRRLGFVISGPDEEPGQAECTQAGPSGRLLPVLP